MRCNLIIFFLIVISVQCVFSQNWYSSEVRWGAHDPTILRHESGYVLMSTNNMLLMMTSEDALHWTNHDRAMSIIPSWLNDVTNNEVGDIWAPDVFYFGGEYRSYYTGSAFGENTSGIGFMSTKSIVPGSVDYGWSDKGEVVSSDNSNNYNAIDADVVVDAENNYWMTFGSWWDGIRLIRLDENTGKQSLSDKTVYRIASRGGSGIEGPSLIEHKGQYFLFTAWDVCCKMGAELEENTYKTAMGRSNTIIGNYVDRSGNLLTNGGGTILLDRYGRYYGPGGGEAFQDLNRIRFAHHYYDANSNGSPTLQIRDLVFTQDNWPEMGQPFMGRYLSAEAEHGSLTNVEISTGTASNGEYIGMINYSDSKVRLPINITQAGEYLLRYRYANGGVDATHNVSINGSDKVINLPSTGAWGVFLENAVVYIPSILTRGGNFIDVKVGSEFAELDRVDFLRIVRDTLPGNGFDNGIKIRLNEDDELAMKDSGWALFENVITDSIVGNKISVEVKSCGGGSLNLHVGSQNSNAISTCILPANCDDNTWTEVECTEMDNQSGVKDLYLTSKNNAKEFLVRNIHFKNEELVQVQNQKEPKVSLEYNIQKQGLNYVVKFTQPGNYLVRVVSSSGQVLESKFLNNIAEVRLNYLPQIKTFIQVQNFGGK